MGHDGREFIKSFTDESKLSPSHKVENFPVYSNRQNISRFLALHELFKLQLHVKGSIVDCGVFSGHSLFAFAQFSGIYEPANYHRQIIGFDTFSGFPSWSELDEFNPNRGKFKPDFDSFDELKSASNAYQRNHYLESESKVKLIKGDALATIPDFLKNNNYFVCSMLYLDFDLYEPTKIALESFIPRMPKGSVLAFDEIHNSRWPGETQALMDVIGINNLNIQSFPFNPDISFAILQ